MAISPGQASLQSVSLASASALAVLRTIHSTPYFIILTVI
jgi:hypothetical protein